MSSSSFRLFFPCREVDLIIQNADRRSKKNKTITTVTVNDVASDITSTTLVNGSRAFGLHNPVAVNILGIFLRGSSSSLFHLAGYFNNFGYATPALAVSLVDALQIKQFTGRDVTISVS